MTVPAAIFWCLAAWAIYFRGSLHVYLPWLCLPFGALAVVDPKLSLGSTILPFTIAASIFVAKTAMHRTGRSIMLRSAVDLRGLGLLSIFALYAAVSAYTCPRLFAGRVGVLPLRSSVLDAVVPLMPTSANITQAAYTVLAWLFALALVAYLRGGDVPVRRRRLVKAIAWGGLVLVITGMIDWLGGKASLMVLRNGTYDMAGFTTVGNIGRISGAFSEPSAFGAATVAWGGLLYFSYPILAAGLFKKFAAPAIIALLFFLAAASTSSTADVGLAVVFLVIVLSALSAVASGIMSRDLTSMSVVGLTLLAICFCLIFMPEIFATPIELINESVFQKARSTSFIERNFWTTTGYHVFWETWGIGAGAGATRVSSWPAAVASNLGIIGLSSMGTLLLLTILRRPVGNDPGAFHLIRAAKGTLLAVLAMGYVAGTTLDPGWAIASSLAWVLASSAWRPEPVRRTLHWWRLPYLPSHSRFTTGRDTA